MEEVINYCYNVCVIHESEEPLGNDVPKECERYMYAWI